MLTENEFLVLNWLREAPGATQREVSQKTGLALGTVNPIVKQFTDRRYLVDSLITESGLRALEPYKVDNAVIMAAGVSSRFVPLSYEKPKGTLTVRGEVLIERIIRQLKAAGINDITVVIGYMKEQYFYLEDAFDVKLVINTEYRERNNNSSLKIAEDRLKNTFVVASDNYFVENVFAPYVYKAYYAAVFMQGPTDEVCLRTGSGKRINKAFFGGSDEWVMMGQTYFDRAFSERFVEVLNRVYDLPETKQKLWEEIYMDSIGEFDMDIRKYPDGIIYEFDSLEDVRKFDPDFITNIASDIFDNICTVLSCTRNEISGIRPIIGGLSNFSFYFKVNDAEYVYRHPGLATQGLLNRAVEAEVEEIARELGLDETFLYQDTIKGWKISKFVHITEPFDYFNDKHVETALSMIKKLHRSGAQVNNTFDLHEETEKIKRLLLGKKQLDFPDFEALDSRILRLYEHVSQDTVPCLCHSDFYDPNILISDDKFYLIDWEYTGMSDYASDLGTFVCCSHYNYDEAMKILEVYFERELTRDEIIHCMAYVALAGYYWFIWALNKEVANEPVGEWLHLWYSYAKDFSIIAEKLLDESTAE